MAIEHQFMPAAVWEKLTKGEQHQYIRGMRDGMQTCARAFLGEKGGEIFMDEMVKTLASLPGSQEEES